MTHAAVSKVRQGLESGVLSRDDLTARRLARYLGATTSLLYHHWGSVDGFLRAVSESAFEQFEASLRGFEERDADHEAFRLFGRNYLRFAWHNETLYRLMFERQLPSQPVEEGHDRRTPAGRVIRALVNQFRCAGSARAKDDARLFHATLHGLASLTINGRLGDGEQRAIEAVDRLLDLFLSHGAETP